MAPGDEIEANKFHLNIGENKKLEGFSLMKKRQGLRQVKLVLKNNNNKQRVDR